MIDDPWRHHAQSSYPFIIEGKDLLEKMKSWVWKNCSGEPVEPEYWIKDDKTYEIFKDFGYPIYFVRIDELHHYKLYYLKDKETWAFPWVYKEHFCEHGVGHFPSGKEHGCDGCCKRH